MHKSDCYEYNCKNYYKCNDNTKLLCNDKYSCNKCVQGPMGPAGPQGIQGPPGENGGVLNFSDFYALMPPDNAATVAVGTDVSFSQNGPTSGADISRITDSSFNLSLIGTYQVFFQVGTNEAG